MQRRMRNLAGYGLLGSVPRAAVSGVFYQGPCPAKTARRPGVCASCTAECDLPLDPCPRMAPVCEDVDCLVEVTASAEDCECGCGCDCGCGCGCDCGCAPELAPGPVIEACEDYYAVLSAQCPADMRAGESVRLSMVRGGGRGMRPCAEGVEFLKDGTYFATYCLHAPEGSRAGAALGLCLDGRRLRESEAPLMLDGAMRSAGFCGQSVIRARRGQRLGLVSQGDISFPRGAAEAPLASMTVVRLSP